MEKAPTGGKVPSADDRAVARALAEEIAATDDGRAWQKVTSLLQRFGANRLSPSIRARIGAALDAEGLEAKPPFEDLERFETVRLSIVEAGEPATRGRTRSMTRLVPVEEAIQVTRWQVGQSPERIENIFSLGAEEGILWLDVDVLHIEPETVFEVIAPVCPGLERETLLELFRVDPLPHVGAHRGARFVSAFGIEAEETERSDEADESKAGALSFHLVEVLAGDGWVITGWHRGQRYEGIERISESPPWDTTPLEAGVETEWRAAQLSSAGDLATLVLHQLARGYPAATRVLSSWLEQWELDFHQRLDGTERRTLIAVRALLVEFQQRLAAFEQPGEDPVDAWFRGLTTETWARRVNELVMRGRDDLVSLNATLMNALDLLAAQSSAEQLRLAQVQAERSSRFERKIVLISVILLVPGLIAEMYASNETHLPFRGEAEGLGFLLLLMGVASLVIYLLIRPREPDSDE